MKTNSPDTCCEASGLRISSLTKLAAVHLGPVFHDPVQHLFLLEEGVFENYRLYSVAGQIVAAGRSFPHSGWTRPASCLDRLSLVFSRTSN